MDSKEEDMECPLTVPGMGDVMRSHIVPLLSLGDAFRLARTASGFRWVADDLPDDVHRHPKSLDLVEFFLSEGLRVVDLANPILLADALERRAPLLKAVRNLCLQNFHPAMLTLIMNKVGEVLEGLDTLVLPNRPALISTLDGVSFNSLTELHIRDPCETALGYTDQSAYTLASVLSQADTLFPNLRVLETEFLSRRIWDHLPGTLVELLVLSCGSKDYRGSTGGVLGNKPVPNLERLEVGYLCSARANLRTQTPNLRHISFPTTPRPDPLNHDLPSNSLPLRLPDTVKSVGVWNTSAHLCGDPFVGKLSLDWLFRYLHPQTVKLVTELQLGGKKSAVNRPHPPKLIAALSKFESLESLDLSVALPLDEVFGGEFTPRLSKLVYRPPTDFAKAPMTKTEEMGEMLSGLKELELRLPTPTLPLFPPESFATLLKTILTSPAREEDGKTLKVVLGLTADPIPHPIDAFHTLLLYQKSSLMRKTRKKRCEEVEKVTKEMEWSVTVSLVSGDPAIHAVFSHS